jgi:hypothetical protein
MVRSIGVALVCLAAVGCAHHQNQYAYAPPLAPPVYPQPAAAPAAAVPHPTQPGMMPPAVAPGPLPPVTMVPGEECCPPNGEGAVVVAPVVYEEGQSPACPPGP